MRRFKGINFFYLFRVCLPIQICVKFVPLFILIFDHSIDRMFQIVQPIFYIKFQLPFSSDVGWVNAQWAGHL